MEQTQEQSIMQDPMMGFQQGQVVMPPDQGTASLISTINPADTIAELEHQLRGEVWVHKDQAWAKKKTEFLNEAGVNKIITIVKSIVNTNCILSNLNDKEISRLMYTIGSEITILLAMQHKTYAVNKANMGIIVQMCCWVCFLTLKRSLNQGEKRFLRQSISSNEHILVKPQQDNNNGKSFFNIFRR